MWTFERFLDESSKILSSIETSDQKSDTKSKKPDKNKTIPVRKTIKRRKGKKLPLKRWILRPRPHRN